MLIRIESNFFSDSILVKGYVFFSQIDLIGNRFIYLHYSTIGIEILPPESIPVAGFSFSLVCRWQVHEHSSVVWNFTSLNLQPIIITPDNIRNNTLGI